MYDSFQVANSSSWKLINYILKTWGMPMSKFIPTPAARQVVILLCRYNVYYREIKYVYKKKSTKHNHLNINYQRFW